MKESIRISWKKRYFRSFSYAEILVSLIVLSLCMEILSQISILLTQIDADNELAQDSIAASQLRTLLILAEDIVVEDDSLSYRLDDQEFEIYLVNRRLIITPGTQILFENIDDAAFEETEDKIYVSVYRNHSVVRLRIY